MVETPPKRDEFPTWALIPIGLLVVILIAVLYFVLGRDNTDTANVRVSVTNDNTRPPTVITQATPMIVQSAPTAPMASVPQSSQSIPGAQTKVAEAPTKGSVSIDAKVITRNGATQAVRNERFYLLDQDIETILGAAGIEPIEGQSLTGSLGLSVVFPDQYRSFNRDAMNAIKKHVKYAGQTDAGGKASVSGVVPNSYYLFGMTKMGSGFSIWNSPVTIQVGQNALSLTPQTITEIRSPTG